MKCQKALFLIVGSCFFCSCAMVDSTTKKIGLADTEEKSEAFYVGVSGLKLFPDPRFSKTCIAELPLDEKVLRDRLEKGFAHVKVVRTGQTGWVNNAHLVWKRPPPPKSLPPKPTPTKKPSEENVIQESSQPNYQVEGRDASIFNAF